MGTDPWPIIHAERSALARDLTGLMDGQWNTPSLCERWTVRDVLGHLTATTKMTSGRFLGHFTAAGFRFNAMTAKDVTRETAGTTAEQLKEFRDHIRDTTSPPGPVEAMLGEIILHAEDIRRPLGIRHDYPLAAVVRVAEFFAASNLIVGAKRRVTRLTLRATDTAWAYGSGPEVTGPVLSLALAMTGRADALEDLRGRGLDTLRAR